MDKWLEPRRGGDCWNLESNVRPIVAVMFDIYCFYRAHGVAGSAAVGAAMIAVGDLPGCGRL